MGQLSEFENSYAHVLLYPPQPAEMLTLEGRRRNFSTRMYGIYLEDDGCRLVVMTRSRMGVIALHSSSIRFGTPCQGACTAQPAEALMLRPSAARGL